MEPANINGWRTAGKLLASAFIVLNLVSVLFINGGGLVKARDGVLGRLSPWSAGQVRRLGGALEKACDFTLAGLPPPAAYRVELLGWRLRQYAHLTGLDATWQMFSRVRGPNWWFIIKAVYADGSVVVLPLPNQSRRTPWQRLLLDFKETKFLTNLHSDPLSQVGYSKYLWRQFPEHNGSPIRAVLWELYHQDVRDARDAAKHGSHLQPEIHQSTFRCYRPERTLTPEVRP